MAVTKKSLKAEAKRRGLKKYSTLNKRALEGLLAMDDRGTLSSGYLTKRRMKEIQQTRIPQTIARVPSVTQTITRVPARTLLLKEVKEKKARECAKYKNLVKKSKAELMRLL